LPNVTFSVAVCSRVDRDGLGVAVLLAVGVGVVDPRQDLDLARREVGDVHLDALVERQVPLLPVGIKVNRRPLPRGAERDGQAAVSDRAMGPAVLDPLGVERRLEIEQQSVVADPSG